MAGDVADQHSFERADRDLPGAAHARAETQENRRVANVAHCKPDHGDVFHDPAVYRLQREPAAALEDAVGDGNVPESAIRLRTALDAAGALPAVVLPGIRKAFEAAVEQRSELIAAGNVAIGDRNVLGHARKSERKRALRADRVVP